MTAPNAAGNNPKKYAERTVVITRVFDAPRELVFTNIAIDAEGNTILDGLTKVTFVERHGKTTVTVDTTAAAVVSYAAAHLEGMEAGWTQSIDKLAALFAKA